MEFCGLWVRSHPHALKSAHPWLYGRTQKENGVFNPFMQFIWVKFKGEIVLISSVQTLQMAWQFHKKNKRKTDENAKFSGNFGQYVFNQLIGNDEQFHSI